MAGAKGRWRARRGGRSAARPRLSRQIQTDTLSPLLALIVVLCAAGQRPRGDRGNVGGRSVRRGEGG
eukprot:scaffold142648_cov27-Tisochrysis_lutea.AAC.3